MKRGIVVLAAALSMSMGMSVASYAASWEHDSKGWWY
ncbi:MAG: serine protease, partial [Lachnoanaerobaculum sp.]|nr:serine protease [Lachnoanaerobaculum sp.]